MDLPLGVLVIYAALAARFVVLIGGFKRGSYSAFLLCGMALMLVLNIRYFIEDSPAAIAFFIGI